MKIYNIWRFFIIYKDIYITSDVYLSLLHRNEEKGIQIPIKKTWAVNISIYHPIVCILPTSTSAETIIFVMLKQTTLTFVVHENKSAILFCIL